MVRENLETCDADREIVDKMMHELYILKKKLDDAERGKLSVEMYCTSYLKDIGRLQEEILKLKEPKRKNVKGV